VYRDLLGRPADPTALSIWTQALQQGLTREQVAMEIGTSVDYFQSYVASVYEAYLGRPPDQTSLITFPEELQTGLSEEQLQAAVLASPEFFARTGGTDQAFVDGLYCALLGRHADPSSAEFVDRLAAGTLTRMQVAQAVLSSPEYLQDLVRGWLLRYLRRADPTAEAFYAGALEHGATNEQVIAAILGSNAYFDEFNTPTLSIFTIRSGGSITLALERSATITMQVFRVKSRGSLLLPAVQRGATADAVSSMFKLPKLKLLGVVKFGHHRKGHFTLRWNRTVNTKKLTKGRYELVILLHRGRRLIGVSNPVPFAVR
jgi:Domain of unknown function (DUF4214)